MTTTDEYSQGYSAAILRRPRNSNPYARGWSRSAALVMPESLAACWDEGWQHGTIALEKLAKIMRNE